MKRKPSLPTPAQLLAKANALPRRGVALNDYVPVMWTLKSEKGLSLREIAAWLSAELHAPVTHMQVYRAMDASLPPPEQFNSVEKVEANENKRADLMKEAKK